MNNYIIYITLLGSVISLIGTMLGASLGVIIKNPSNKLLGTIVGFAAGLMLSIVMFDLIPESLNNWNFLGTILFCVLGIIIIAFIDSKLKPKIQDNNIKMAVITAAALMIHNFPEGIIMGCGFAAGSILGIKMAIVITIHDIPEGIAVSAPLMASKVNISKILVYSFLTALPTAIGTFVGVFIGGISKNILEACISFASGIMLYVVCGEMIPESSKLWKGISSTIGTLLGIILGMLITHIL
ncbi:zinc transporter ZupT [Clostridium acetireducens DSM 10703]|uniref:Zinc transporter ZupT n=1 Tax=Clostridium acetireducens DSM 10703 TaxID=1121290 RepID=A0A1E8EZQ1_9CLOT|nr:ZIP family metal transporter [Clostridium acetireducens]OFI06197.1 zinc transporter ZupT [Clostridium acetireducens DSM 10703]